MDFTLPDFSDVEDADLRKVVEDLKFQRDVAIAFLGRAMAEQRNRRRNAKEGIFRSRPPAAPPTPKAH